MYRDRRLYSPAPDIKGPIEPNGKPVKICLIAAAVLMFFIACFFWYTGMAVLYVHYWAYIAAASVLVLLLLSAGAFAIYNRMKSEQSRRYAKIILVGVMLMLVMVAFSLCYAFATIRQPMGFFDSPEGENRIIVMKTPMEEGIMVEAYPAIGNHFYVAAIESEMVHSNGVIQGAEWENERLVHLLMEDIDGNDTTLTVDFALLYAGEEEAE